MLGPDQSGDPGVAGAASPFGGEEATLKVVDDTTTVPEHHGEHVVISLDQG